MAGFVKERLWAMCDYYSDGAERARENAYHDRIDREEREYFRNRSHRPTVLLDRLWHFVSWTLTVEPFGRAMRWW
jgi:hypothetical protein